VYAVGALAFFLLRLRIPGGLSSGRAVVRWPSLKTVIHWFRRDLRISDNTALHAAWKGSERLVPFFCWDDAVLAAPDTGPAQVAFLLRSLESLAGNLAALGHRLIVRRGKPDAELLRLCRETGASAVYTNRDYEPYSRDLDRRATLALGSVAVAFHALKDAVVHEDRDVLTKAGGVFTVFTPYSKAWKALPASGPLPKIGAAKLAVPAQVVSLPLPEDSAALGHPLRQELFPAGERAARRVLDAFVEERVFGYAMVRNHPADDTGTSRLSPHLRFGTVNIRTVLDRLAAARAGAVNAGQVHGAEVWLSELVWREFYMQILSNHPHVAAGAFRPEYGRLEWTGKDEWFEAWCVGQTGYPVVDAAMRCLNATGWMHNRLRMIVAMFLTKDLLVSWQRGERYFMRMLVDGDLAANNGGWQWSTGCGTDAAPYFRIFNPVTQGEKFDPDGVFVKRWIPELRDAPKDLVHRPWESPLLLGRSRYPARIVEHDVQRKLCLAMFKAVKGDGGKLDAVVER